jgi:phage gp29-like protein
VSSQLARRSQAIGNRTLLDAYGRDLAPSSVGTRRVALGNPRGIDTYNSHPGFGLEPEMLLSYHRKAERGQPMQQFDCWDDQIERDGSLRGMLNDRNESVSGCEFVVMPPPGRSDVQSVRAASELNDRLQNRLTFREFIAHQLTSIPYGAACTNMVWEYEEGIAVPYEFVNPPIRRFAAPSAERADEIWMIDATGGSIKLVELQYGLWTCSRYRFRNPWAAGLMRTCAWLSMFKATGFRDWRVFAEMFGIPLAIGYYEEGAGPRSREALEEAVRQIGEDGYAVLSSLTELVIKETARGGDSSTCWPPLIKACEDQMSILITGGTLNTSVASVGSYNAAQVHESRGYTMKCADAMRLQEVFTRDIGIPFIAYNGYDRAAPPRLKIKIRRDALQWAQTLEIIGMAMELDQDQVREDFGLREPAPGRGVKFEPTKPPDPGHAREDKKR